MPQFIATNNLSLNAQRHLNSSQSLLATSIERLSSGLRINSAKDGAAEMAISTRMTAQIQGLNQAARNANDGISFSQTAEGGLQVTVDALLRIRELAVQSANDTNSASDRASLQEEVAQMIAEIDRIANQTQFNGQNILDGSLATSVFHIGPNANQTVSISGVDARASVLGANATTTSTGLSVTDATTAGSLTSPSGVLSINGTVITVNSDGLSTTDDASSANALAAGINDLAGTTGVTATANATTADLGAVTADDNGLASGAFSINGVEILTGAISAGDSDGTLRDAINAVQLQTGVTAELDSSNNLILTALDGRNIQLTTAGGNTDSIAAPQAVFGNFDLSGAANDDVVVGTVTLDSNNAIVVDTGIDAATYGQAIAAGTYNITTTNSVTNVDISTRAGANLAITNVDRALDAVNSLRSTFGAIQSRFEAIVTSLQTTSENLSAARSRIRDADFAEETANLARAQILQQAGIAMVAQANVLPQNALALLG
ncbi:MAG: flagellin N-terminal helical domain-containing protein [Gammaproteobacteria bacterium]